MGTENVIIFSVPIIMSLKIIGTPEFFLYKVLEMVGRLRKMLYLCRLEIKNLTIL